MKNMTLIFIFLTGSLQLFAASAVNSQLPQQKPFFDLDISGSSGTYNGKSYTEAHIGLNLNLTNYLTWRNAAFKRFSSSTDAETSGLDTSLRLNLDSPFDGGGLNFFAGPGYRWTSGSDKNALFAEAGASIRLGALTLGAGAKYLRYDKIQLDSAGLETKRDDTNYFVTIAGGTGITF